MFTLEVFLSSWYRSPRTLQTIPATLINISSCTWHVDEALACEAIAMRLQLQRLQQCNSSTQHDANREAAGRRAEPRHMTGSVSCGQGRATNCRERSNINQLSTKLFVRTALVEYYQHCQLKNNRYQTLTTNFSLVHCVRNLIKSIKSIKAKNKIGFEYIFLLNATQLQLLTILSRIFCKMFTRAW